MSRDPLGGAQTAPVIRPNAQAHDDDETLDFRRLLPAWIISGVVHVLVLSLFLLVTVAGNSASGSISTEPIVMPIQTEADQDEVKIGDNDDIGKNPDLKTNYDLAREGEQSIPGQDRPAEPIGLINGIDIPARTAPPLPGPFTKGGENGGIDLLKPGPGFDKGNIGGMGGVLSTQIGFGRSGVTRERMLDQNGGNPASEAAVAAGLKWIVRHQALDGHWSLNEFHVHGRCNCANPGGMHNAGATGLGLLPLLGAGETHKGSGRNHAYAKNVERALKWLIAQQGADGSFSQNGYEHSICAYAMCEAYGMTGDPWLRGPAQRAINRCVTWQRAQGGFRYAHPPANDMDLSVSGWFVQALKSGQMAGLNVPNSAYAGINQYLDAVATAGADAYKYTETHQPSPAMTAVGLLSRQYMGWGPRNPVLAKGIENMEKMPPGAVRNIYYYYYATQSIYHFGGPSWQNWNPKMRDLLIDSQDKGLNPDRADQKGSWSPAGDAWGGQLGRLGATSLSLLTLEVYYRYLPLYQRELAAMKDEAIR